MFYTPGVSQYTIFFYNEIAHPSSFLVAFFFHGGVMLELCRRLECSPAISVEFLGGVFVSVVFFAPTSVSSDLTKRHELEILSIPIPFTALFLSLQLSDERYVQWARCKVVACEMTERIYSQHFIDLYFDSARPLGQAMSWY